MAIQSANLFVGEHPVSLADSGLLKLPIWLRGHFWLGWREVVHIQLRHTCIIYSIK